MSYRRGIPAGRSPGRGLPVRTPRRPIAANPATEKGGFAHPPLTRLVAPA